MKYYATSESRSYHNPSNRTKREGRELIEAAGCEVLYLPLYNPIEEAFSKIKGILRKGGARTRELIEAMGWAILSVDSRDAEGLFKHCGYRAVV